MTYEIITKIEADDRVIFIGPDSAIKKAFEPHYPPFPLTLENLKLPSNRRQ
jgi:hypothetical protein